MRPNIFRNVRVLKKTFPIKLFGNVVISSDHQFKKGWIKIINIIIIIIFIDNVMVSSFV